ncbi:MAG TPA: cytochrome ubiquinol oxidase subunit I [Candidatus Baltobacteraceae bacterium]
MDLVAADRLQFAFTIMFHYLFPIGTMGLAPFVAWYHFKAWRDDDAEAGRIAAFWTKIFAINFAAGVVTGIPMEFAFGTNWAAFSAKNGAVVGQPLALEGIYAFFLESIFLGVLLYGRTRVARGLHVVSAVLVCLGSWLSGYFIVVTDAWMQHPVGGSLGALLTNPFALWQFVHVIVGALLAGGFIVAGVGAFYLLARRDDGIGRRFVRAGVLTGLLFSLLAIFPTGDRNSADVTKYQPVKLAAMEGLFDSTRGAPLAIIGMPDVPSRKLIDPVVAPSVLSFLAYGSFTANVDGLNAYATTLWPPVELTYYAYHVMVGLGTIFAALSAMSVLLLLWRRRLFEARWLLWLLLLTIPFPYIANEAGWVVTEVGRQPWIVYGLMRTSAGVSPNVPAGETIFTIIGFAGMYFLIGVLFLFLTLREVGVGPNHAQRPAVEASE